MPLSATHASKGGAVSKSGSLFGMDDQNRYNWHIDWPLVGPLRIATQRSSAWRAREARATTTMADNQASHWGNKLMLRQRRIGQWLSAVLVIGLVLCWPMGQPIQAASFGDNTQAVSASQVLRSSHGGTGEGPELVKLGVFITRLDNFNLRQKSYDATFWLWSVTPQDFRSKLDSLEFVNAEEIKFSNNYVKQTPAGVWNQRRVVGRFNHNWDMRNFPFDHQDLTIEIEEAESYLKDLVYVPDHARFFIDEGVNLPGWRIVSSQVRAGSKTYQSSFGDPALQPGNPTSYSRINVIVRLERTNITAFWKFTAGAYVAAVIALASYAFHVDQGQTMSARFGLLAGAVFAAIISLRSESSELGTTEYNTMVDQVHLVTLVYVLIATLTGVYTWSRFRKDGNAKAIERLGRRMAVASTMVMILVICGLVRRAALA